jgi:hypothetical protein
VKKNERFFLFDGSDCSRFGYRLQVCEFISTDSTERSFSPKAQEGLNALHDFFGGFGSHSGEFEGHSGEFKGHSGEIGIENFGGLGALGNMFGVGNVFNQVFGSWSKMFGQIMSGDIFGALFSAIKGIVDNILSIFGGLGGNSRLELNTALSKTGNVFASTMKSKNLAIFPNF